MQVGTVSELWRYPVKSMVGERLPSLDVTTVGVVGDRGWAVRNEAKGAIQGAKKIGGLMGLRARFLAEPTTHDPSPPVEVTLPDGAVVRSDDPDVDARISAALGLDVTLHPLRPVTDAEHYARGSADHDDVEDELRAIFGRTADEPLPTLEGFGPDLIGQLMQYESPLGTYYDAFPLHVLTDASLRSLGRLVPDSVIDVRRFRPNVVLALDDADGFPEQSWVGRTLAIGEVVIDVQAPCPRCVMPTRGFADVPEDRRVLRAIVRELDQNMGVYAEVPTPGRIAVGDQVVLA